LITYIFDFDGTLANTFDLILEAVNYYALQYGYTPLTHTEAVKLRSLSAQKVLVGLGLSHWKVFELMLKVRRYMQSRMQQVNFYPGVLEVLQHLKAEGHDLGIVSSNSAKNVSMLLQKENCHLFSFICPSSHLLGKARVLKRLLKEKKLDKNQVYYIGDEVRDIEAAHHCGIQMIAVSWGFNTKELLVTKHPKYLIEAIQELKNL